MDFTVCFQAVELFQLRGISFHLTEMVAVKYVTVNSREPLKESRRIFDDYSA